MIEMAAGLQFSFPKPNQLAAAANFSRIYLRKCKNEVEYKFSSIVLIGDTNGTRLHKSRSSRDELEFDLSNFV